MLFEMENNYQEGDLTDIVRGRKSTSSSNYGCKTEDQEQQQQQQQQPFSSSEWQFSSQVVAMNNNNFSSSSSSSELQDRRRRQAAARSSSREEEDQLVEYSFGDPFCASAAMRDPLLLHHHQEDQLDDLLYNNNSSSSATFFNGGCGNLEDKSAFGGVVNNNNQQDDVIMIKRPSSCNIFSRMLQISPATTTSITNKFPILSDHSPSSLLIPNSNNNSPTTNHHHFLDNNINNPSSLQISSPRNPPGIKRRKSQARKVVCVPAPVAASSRPNGEVIPSDLWAWRKYGQKPIKGSPYPRGYYRCSSSKGCSARKQVERSRTDPNMLVITYTSEHNHPWPTQRNALAGSSRSQQSKNNNTTPNSSKLSASTKPTTSTTQEDKIKEDQNNNNNNGRTRSSAASNNNVKEEGAEEIDQKQFETEDNIGDHHQLSEEGFQYRVAMAMASNNNNQSDDFFADLEELETHPLNLLFTQGQKLDQISKGGGLDDLVAFNNLFNWGAPENNNNNNNSNNSFEEPPTASKRGFY